MKKIIVSLLGVVVLNTVNAVPTTTPTAKTSASAAVATPTTPAGKFSIPANTPLTAKLMDQAWAAREDDDNQKAIADYLTTYPTVPQDYETAWKTARMVYFIGNYGAGEAAFVSTSAGAKLFDYGAKAGLIAIAANPARVEGQYWYAVDLGSYGLAKGVFAAAKGAGPGMKALETAMSIDPTYHYYGSSRILGRYYQELPGLMGGSNKKALSYLTKATVEAPKYRNNWTFLGQYYLSTDDYKNAEDACQKAVNATPIDGKFEEKRFKREANDCLKKAQAKLANS